MLFITISNVPFFITIHQQFKIMSILLALLITVAIIVIGFFVACLATITYSDPFYVPNKYDVYRLLKERSENKGRPFDYVDFNDFLERHEGIKVGSAEYEKLKKIRGICGSKE